MMALFQRHIRDVAFIWVELLCVTYLVCTLSFDFDEATG